MSSSPPPSAALLLAVAAGGGTGAGLRWSLDAWLPAGDGIPWTTLTINVAGCFALALLPAFERVRRSPLLPPALGSGVLGGFTTLSAVSEQTRGLLADGRLALASAYSLGTLALGLLAVLLADRVSTAAQRAEFEAEEGDL